jgi:hypothetical protein
MALDRDVSAAQTTARDALGKLEILERRFEKLKLYNAALTAVIIKKLNVTEAEINDMVNSIDLMDGKVDGTLVSSVRKCTHCGKVLSARQERCLYCSTLDTNRSFLETV